MDEFHYVSSRKQYINQIGKLSCRTHVGERFMRYLTIPQGKQDQSNMNNLILSELKFHVSGQAVFLLRNFGFINCISHNSLEFPLNFDS